MLLGQTKRGRRAALFSQLLLARLSPVWAEMASDVVMVLNLLETSRLVLVLAKP